MAAAALVSNGDYAAVQTPATGRYAAGYSEVQNSRLDHSLPLPSVLKSSFKVVDGPPSSAAGNPGIHATISAQTSLRTRSCLAQVLYEFSICFFKWRLAVIWLPEYVFRIIRKWLIVFGLFEHDLVTRCEDSCYSYFQLHCRNWIRLVEIQ